MQSRSVVFAGVRVLSLLAAGILFVSALVRAILHLRDLTGIQHIAGVWMALAQYGNAGVLYPPLEAEGLYGGTRYMPMCFALIGALVKLVGDYVAAAKLMALASMVLLLAGVFVAVRRITGRRRDALLLTGLVLASPEGMTALLSPHADALAAAFAVLGLLLIPREQPGAGRCCLAALLFTAALLTKFSAVAGPLAAAAFLLFRDRRSAPWLLAPWMVLSMASLILLQHFSDGRFLDNFRTLGSGGMSLDSIRIAPARVAFALSQTPAFAVILGLAVVVVLARARRHALNLWDWYFLFTAAVTLTIFTSPGTGLNHLLELEIAAVLVIASLLAAAPAVQWTPRLIVLALLIVAMAEEARRLRTVDPTAIADEIVVATLPAHAHLLAEDATVPVLLGQRPIVMDPFSFRVLAEQGRIEDRALAERIERREFDVLVLLGRVDQPDASLCPRFHFGARVTTAMREAYRFDQQVGPYYLFVPTQKRN